MVRGGHAGKQGILDSQAFTLKNHQAPTSNHQVPTLGQTLNRTQYLSDGGGGEGGGGGGGGKCVTHYTTMPGVLK